MNQSKECWSRCGASKVSSTLLALMLLLGCQSVAGPMSAAAVQPEKDANATELGADAVPSVHHEAVAEGAVPPVSASSRVSTTALTATGTLPASAEAVASSAPDTAALIAAGQELYLKQYCGVCHQLDALGTQGTFGPPHNGMGQRAAERIRDPDYRGHAHTAADYLMESLTDPAIYAAPDYELTSHPMPNYGYLSEVERQALVALLLDQH